jgi:hypothetical protein
MFLLYHSEGCNIYEMVLHECYINDLHTTTCSGMLGHHNCALRDTETIFFVWQFLSHTFLPYISGTFDYKLDYV